MTLGSITGKVATDPTARIMRDGSLTAQFFIQDEASVYHHVRCFSALAAGAAAFLKTGTLVLVRGKLKAETWTDHNDIRHSQMRILAIRIDILDAMTTSAKARADNNEGK